MFSPMAINLRSIESKSPNIQPIRRPKDLVAGMDPESWVAGGTATVEKAIASPCCAVKTAMVRAPDARSIFLDHLTSPFGVALVGSDLLHRRRYKCDRAGTSLGNPGDTEDALQPGRALTPLPEARSTIATRTKRPRGQPRRFAAFCRRRIYEQQHHRETEWKRRRIAHAIWEVDRATGRWHHLRKRTAQSERADLRTRKQSAVDESRRLRPTIFQGCTAIIADAHLAGVCQASPI